MRLYTYEAKNRVRLGAGLNGRLIDLNAAHAARRGRKGAELAASMLDLIRGGPGTLAQARAALAFAAKHPARAKAWSHDLDRAKVLAPIPRPGKIFCSGLNY